MRYATHSLEAHGAPSPRATASIALPDTYRGWTISRGRWPEPAWSASSPNYDVSYEGPEEGWIDNGEKANASTRDALLSEIDAWFEDRAA
jgi:hypothetical protein